MTAGTSRLRVLLVNTSRDEREMYADWFRAHDCCALQAETAHDAYRLASELAPTVVVIEHALVGQDGITLARRLKQAPATRLAVVVVLTSYLSDRDRDRAVHAGCDLLVLKPCTPDMLAASIARLLDARGAMPPPLLHGRHSPRPTHREGT